jgi:hypothetical protein
MQKNKLLTTKSPLSTITSFIISVSAGLLIYLSAVSFTLPPKEMPKANVAPVPMDLYTKLNLSSLGLSETAFNLALKGWEKLKAKGEVSKSIISICDFTQSSNHKRLYVIDLASGKLLFHNLFYN